ncbi:family 1 glycosylhydrolase [Oxalobacteraceae bacterium R-40]|uniref:dTDP-4-dehydrorhamnose reductase n=1 Tax=Keguizhuia sedimenti TaxID=3064264 RepID=A0ABU1BNP1_9BURK|nr:family 1 glycosylhydrolase [Oxalobacteraceae bacterium R-40]
MGFFEHSVKESKESARLQIWGGLECTVARIGDVFRNQIKETGHFYRSSDLEQVASLGIRTLRYPILWECVSPEDPAQENWQWHDERLHALRNLEIDPIAGLIHHGSGPRYTSLLDPAFPDLLAKHAEKVALRYPWIRFFTPVNEPLTTARFSGLYGHWYPHGQNVRTFMQALIHQCRAVVLSMKAIRRVIPEAKLVQTDDLGKIFSTPLLQYQADYENERRWLSFDLLCGRIDQRHPWYKKFLAEEIDERELLFFLENPCVPDILGINHYLTSERFLDHRLEHYPHYHHAGNGRHQYADVEAVRVDLPHDQIGPYARLKEAWERYRLPMAVTEAHHGCSRDEQLRWLMEVWKSALKLKSEGADIRAVTVWSMFGATDWNTLLTQQNGFYEPGVFDIRSAEPRATALATATASLASTGNFDHPVLDRHGWWKRDERYYRPPARSGIPRLIGAPRRLLITGATGTLGHAFSRICQHRGLDHDLLKRSEMDITDPIAVENVLSRYRPWAVINTAGFVRVAEAENNAERCYKENALGPENLARACARLEIPFVTFSSDLVFDGECGRAYVESDPVRPSCVYGGSKADAEARVLAVWKKSLVIRTSAFFGPWDRYSFVHAVLRDLSAGLHFHANDSVLVSPTYVPDLVHATLDLLIDGETGVWHLANQDAISWHGLAFKVAQEAGVSTDLLVRIEDDNTRLTALGSERGLIMPPLESAIQRFLRESTVSWRSESMPTIAMG